MKLSLSFNFFFFGRDLVIYTKYVTTEDLQAATLHNNIVFLSVRPQKTRWIRDFLFFESRPLLIKVIHTYNTILYFIAIAMSSTIIIRNRLVAIGW